MAWRLNKLQRNVIEINCELTKNKDWEQWVLLRSDVHHSIQLAAWAISWISVSSCSCSVSVEDMRIRK